MNHSDSQHGSSKKIEKVLSNIDFDQQSGDASLKLNKIKVKNVADWDSRKSYKHSSKRSSQHNSLSETLVIDTDVKVTYYRMSAFIDTFPEYLASTDCLHASLSPKFNRDMVFKAGEGAGRSGSFFFFSHDRKFIIKTMTKGELDLFLKIQPRLSEHHKKTPRSLLCKIFGVFTVKMSKVDAVHIMLMENTMRLKDPDRLKHVFDLKGSRVDRKVKGQCSPSTTLKDINFIMAAKASKNFTLQTMIN